MLQDRWTSGHTKTVNVYHVIDHLPLESTGNDVADTLAQVSWLEGKPASDVAQWLHQCFLHMGQKTMWAVACWWGLLLTFEEVSTSQKECLVCSKRDLHEVPTLSPKRASDQPSSWHGTISVATGSNTIDGKAVSADIYRGGLLGDLEPYCP